MEDNKIPFHRSLLWILVSTLFVSGSAFMGWLYFLHIRDRRQHDDQYNIVAIIQRSSHADSLKTFYLAELLGLSLDHPINLYQFNAKLATRTLRSNPLIKYASVKKLLPGSLLIDYQLRIPIAYVGDFSNTVIDEEGYLFPFRPFFTPKRLPTLYLGLGNDECQWGNCLKGNDSLSLAFSILEQFKQLELQNYELKQLDVAQAQADNYGQRQIVLMLEESKQKINLEQPLVYLRLSCDHALQDLANFQTLQVSSLKKNGSFNINQKKISKVLIDLRIRHLAFIKSLDAS